VAAASGFELGWSRAVIVLAVAGILIAVFLLSGG
jgi:hypothetical protein